MKETDKRDWGLSRKSVVNALLFLIIGLGCACWFPPRQSHVQRPQIHQFAAWPPRPDQLPGPREITLVTQLSLSRLSALGLQCSLYPHTIAAAVYAPTVNGLAVSSDPQWDGIQLKEVRKRLESWFQQTEESGRCKFKASLYTESFENRIPALLSYPINFLRNRALELAQTEIVLVLDVDFLPSFDATSKWSSSQEGYDKLLRAVQRGFAIVASAFEPIAQSPESWEIAERIARGGRTAAVEALQTGELIPFRIWQHHHMAEKNNTERETAWAVAQSPYTMDYKPGWEPCIFYNRTALPKFEEDFRGYGKNRLIHVQQMHILGIKFVVSLDAFVVHLWHPPIPTYVKSAQKEAYNEVLDHWRDIQKKFSDQKFYNDTIDVDNDEVEMPDEENAGNRQPKSRFEELQNWESNTNKYTFGVIKNMPESPSREDLVASAARCAKIDTNVEFVHEWTSRAPLDTQDITIVTQTSLDRLDRVRLQCKIWPGRLSVAVYSPLVKGKVSGIEQCIYDADTLDVLVRKLGHWYNETVDSTGCKLDMSLFIENFEGRLESCGKYPYNALRNRALQSAKTEAVFLLDVDFMPHIQSAKNWHTQEGNQALMHLLQKSALVVPVFTSNAGDLELGTELTLNLIQETKAQMKQEFLKGMKMFLSDYAHGNTNYKVWFDATEAYHVNYTWYYEPFIVLRKEYAPWFDEAFVGYGYDRITYQGYLVSTGIDIMVDPEAFAIHLPHPKSLVLTCTYDDPERFLQIITAGEEAKDELLEGSYIPKSSLCGSPK